jgi:outer membrane protein assembly factor BamB
VKRILLLLASATLAVALTLGLSTLAGARVLKTSKSDAIVPAFSAKDLIAQPGANSVAPHGDDYGQAHTSLTDVAPSNVGNLKLAWHAVLTAPDVADPPVEHGGESITEAYNGILYTEDQLGRVYAYDGTTGNYVWVFEPHNAANYAGNCAVPASCYPNGKPIDLSTAPANIVATAKFIQTQDLGCGLGCSAITAHTVVAAVRGPALGDGMVFVGQSTSNTVYGLDAKTGKEIWGTTVANNKDGSSISVAPVYANGKVILATSGGDRGASCIAFALDAKTGAPLWHFSFIPTKKGMPGYDTWTHPLAYNGGAAVWGTAAVDPVNKIAYFGTGNPLPYTAVVRGKGAELYSTSEVALNIDTGKLVWAFQTPHHDQWDADLSQSAILFDETVGGKPRKAIVFASKSGLWYVLDRLTGKPIIPVKEEPAQAGEESFSYPTQPIPATDPLVQQCPPGGAAAFAGLVAPDGKPFNVGSGPACSFTSITSDRFSITAAFGHGASSQRPASVDPERGIYFNESSPGWNAYKSQPASEITLLQGARFNNEISASLAGTPAADPKVVGSRLGAYSLKTGKELWTVDHLNASGTFTPSANFSAGILSTKSGLVFTVSRGRLQAYDTETAKMLWQSDQLGSGTGLTSLPMSYKANGKQYILIYKDNTSDVYAFSL